LLAEDGADEARRSAMVGSLRAYAATAVSLGQNDLSSDLSLLEALVRATGVLGKLGAEQRRQLQEVFMRIDERIGRIRAGERTPVSGPLPPVRTKQAATRLSRTLPGMAYTVLVVGSRSTAHLLTKGIELVGDDGPRLDVEQIDNPDVAAKSALTLAPDIVVVDADARGAKKMIESLGSNPLTDGIHIVATGNFRELEDAAPLVALGVARTLPKPVSPGALRSACLELVADDARHGFEGLGEMTVDQLSARLSDEVHRALCDAADARSRGQVIDLGTGADVLSAVWGMAARIRELVTAHSCGSVRFAPVDASQAVPFAAWVNGAERKLRSDRAPALQEVRRLGRQNALKGARVVVVEDDLSTNWFITGVLREAGAIVESAFDGAKALDLAFHHAPDLVVSDIIMPELDGFALCRALKRDVLLRGVPVLLLSWKDDLLQRARELGAGADGYLLKDATSSAVMQRVLEVMWPRLHVAKRIKAGGPVRGRLDGLTAHALLRLVCDERPEARLVIRDAHFLYEIEVRDGAPVMASRSTEEGRLERGFEVLAALIGVTSGTFDVHEPADVDKRLAPQLRGTVEGQLRRAVAQARGAQALLTGPRLMKAERVTFNDTRLETQLSCTPEPARGLLRALMYGASPSDIVKGGRAAASLVEALLGDAARHGAVTGVFDNKGDDQLPLAIELQLAVLEGRAGKNQLAEARKNLALASDAFEVTELDHRIDSDEPIDVADLLGDLEPGEETADADAVGDLDDPFAGLREKLPLPAGQAPDDAFDDPIADQEDEQSEIPEDRETLMMAPRAQRPAAPALPLNSQPLEVPAEPVTLPIAAHLARQRALEVPLATPRMPEALAAPAPEQVDDIDESFTDSPDVIFDSSTPPPTGGLFEVGDEDESDPRRRSRADRADRARRKRRKRRKRRERRSHDHDSVDRRSVDRHSVDRHRGDRHSVDRRASSMPPARTSFSSQASRSDYPKVPRVPMPSQYVTHTPSITEAKKSSRWAWPMLFGVLGIGLAVGARFYREHQGVARVAPPAQAVAANPQAVAGPVADPSMVVETPGNQPTELPLSDKEKAMLAQGEALLEVVAGRGSEIRIDGKKIGKGPVTLSPVKAGEQHEVRVKLKGEERVHYVTPKAGVRTRLRVAPPWSR
jgi:CheY-like chemotaxis protein